MKTNWQNMLRPALSAGALVALTLTVLPAQPPAAQPAFATPEEAIHAVGDAAGHNDTAALSKLFGPGGKDLVEPADDAGARENRANFAKMVHEKIQIRSPFRWFATRRAIGLSTRRRARWRFWRGASGATS
jgi:hypothetical protein